MDERRLFGYSLDELHRVRAFFGEYLLRVVQTIAGILAETRVEYAPSFSHPSHQKASNHKPLYKVYIRVTKYRRVSDYTEYPKIIRKLL